MAGQRAMASKRESCQILGGSCCEADEALAHVAQGSCGCPISRGAQVQVGRGPEQTGLVEGVAIDGRLELEDLHNTFQSK